VDLTASPLHDRLVFLVGAQRSGTNWLQRLLATHPDVVTLPGETQLFTAAIDLLAQRVQHGVLGSPSTASVFMDRDAFVAAARMFCDTAFGGVADRMAPGARRIVERSPNHVEHLELIGAVYPDAWIVHIIRDGRDVARSLEAQPWGPRSVAEAATLWARSIRSARAAAPHLARYQEVRYEDLLEDPVSGLGELFRFLELDADATTVSDVLTEAGVAFNTDQRRPDIGQGKWRSEWSRRDLASFERVAGEVRTALGYADATAGGTIAAQFLRAGRRRVLAPKRGQTRFEAATRPTLPMGDRQRVVDTVCASLAGADASSIAELVTADCVVRVVSAASDTRARGEAGISLLTRALLEDGPWGEQTRGDVHISETVWTVVLSHRVGGDQRDRVIVARFGPDDRLAFLAIYGFPL
jgi:hypothetical protein